MNRTADSVFPVDPGDGNGILLNERAERFGHRPGCLWFTGLSGAGKSTLSRAYGRILFNSGRNVYVIDGDDVRLGLSQDLGFAPGDREENIRRVGYLARHLYNAGFIVLCSFISPTEHQRSFVRSLFPGGYFRLVHVRCSLQVCIDRDPKGLYKKALNGDIPDLTGIGSPYEEPVDPDFLVDTAQQSIEDCLALLPDSSTWV